MMFSIESRIVQDKRAQGIEVSSGVSSSAAQGVTMSSRKSKITRIASEQQANMRINNTSKIFHKSVSVLIGQRRSSNRRPMRTISGLNLEKFTLLVSHCPIVVVIVMVAVLAANRVEAQCPLNTVLSFEKVGGVTVDNFSLLTVLYTNVSATDSDHYHHIKNMSKPITAECYNRCRHKSTCRAFLVDYARYTCFSIDHLPNSTATVMRTPAPIKLVPSLDRSTYFEKVCINLQMPNVDDRAWVYERVMSHQIIGYDDKLIDGVQSRLKCQEYCLNEREFKCRSGEYDQLTMQCKLSMIDRHTKPKLFRPTTSNVDYFENQFAPVGSQCDPFDRFEDTDLGRPEIMRFANSSEQCQEICAQTIKAFICRSFTWDSLAGVCYLNSDNFHMIGGIDKLIKAPGLTYFQRNNCIDLKLECDTSTMTVNLRTNEPFRGRMYVRDDPNACETLGRSSLTSSLSIPFQSHARCATRELPSRYSSVVVVQQHPLIQRKSDRYIKLVCDFQTANKTITSTYNVVANPWSSTALINATSFAPTIRLRITDKLGVDITGAKLGDELYLRIEAETDSVYDMVARSVLAKSGTTDESIVLIDKDGCPTDYRIFPTLKKLNRRTIVGKFDAFKFSSDVVVRFQVDVQFCLNQCPATSCDQQLLLNSASSAALGGPIGPVDTYSAGSLTTISPTDSSTSEIPTPMPNQELLSRASLSSSSTSTQAPNVPFQQRGTSSSESSHASGQHRTPMSSAASSLSAFNFSSNPTFGVQQYNNQAFEPVYYNSAGAGASAGRGHHSMPANKPTPSSSSQTGANYSSGQSILDSLVGVLASDSQTFESSQARSASVPASDSHTHPLHHRHQSQQQQQQQHRSSSGAQSAGRQRHQHHYQPLPSNSIETITVETGSGQHEQMTSASVESSARSAAAGGSGNNSRRRRRSAKELSQAAAPSSKHLQREIIVESAPTSTSGSSSSARQNANRQPQQQQQHTPASGRRKPDAKRTIDLSKADGLMRNGPAYDLNASNGQQFEQTLEDLDNDNNLNGKLLCTTRHSLVLASVAFCAVQLLTVGLCMLTWMHRRDVKFKVKHPVQERLY